MLGAFLLFLILLILYECFVTITCTCKNEIKIVTKNKQKTLYISQHSQQDSASVAPLRKHNSVHQGDPTKATILNEQFQSVLVGGLLTASAPFVT